MTLRYGAVDQQTMERSRATKKKEEGNEDIDFKTREKAKGENYIFEGGGGGVGETSVSGEGRYSWGGVSGTKALSQGKRIKNKSSLVGTKQPQLRNVEKYSLPLFRQETGRFGGCEGLKTKKDWNKGTVNLL